MSFGQTVETYLVNPLGRAKLCNWATLSFPSFVVLIMGLAQFSF